MHNFVVHSNERAFRKSGRLELDQVNSQTRPNCLWKIHDIQSRFSRILASYNRSKAATSGHL